MREIKAYVRPEKLDSVMRALRAVGVSHVVVNHVESYGANVDPGRWRISLEGASQYTENAKIEFVCSKEKADELVRVIEQHARTGIPGDGIVFVSTVDRAVKIRSGLEGNAALG